MSIDHFEGLISDVLGKFEDLFDSIRNKDDDEIVLTTNELAQVNDLFTQFQFCIEEYDDNIDKEKSEGQEPNAGEMQVLDDIKLAFEIAQDKVLELKANQATLQDLVDIIDELNG